LGSFWIPFGFLLVSLLVSFEHSDERSTRALKAIGWINNRASRIQNMEWNHEKTLWFSKGWSALTYGCEMDPWPLSNALEKIEVRWMRMAFAVGPNASGWALYWLSGLIPATFRIWCKAFLFFESIQKTPRLSYERRAMETHWDLLKDFADGGTCSPTSVCKVFEKVPVGFHSTAFVRESWRLLNGLEEEEGFAPDSESSRNKS
jgi:hypothetical protein